MVSRLLSVNILNVQTSAVVIVVGFWFFPPTNSWLKGPVTVLAYAQQFYDEGLMAWLFNLTDVLWQDIYELQIFNFIRE